MNDLDDAIDKGDLIHMVLNINIKILDQNKELLEQNEKLMSIVKEYLPNSVIEPRLKIVKQGQP